MSGLDKNGGKFGVVSIVTFFKHCKHHYQNHYQNFYTDMNYSIFHEYFSKVSSVVESSVCSLNYPTVAILIVQITTMLMFITILNWINLFDRRNIVTIESKFVEYNSFIKV